MNDANHEEALQLAHMKREESNLARCYIDLAARVGVLVKALERLGSNEAFYMSRVMGPDDAELIMRIDYAREHLAATKSQSP